MAAASGMSASGVASAAYTIQAQVATPSISPAGGTYANPVTVTITDATAGATVHYTTDGSAPTASSTAYAGPITLTQATTLRAIAAAAGMANSGEASAVYTIQAPVATPTFAPGGGTYGTPQTVTVSDATAGATVYYTTDGSAPTTSSTPYTGPITVSQTTTLRAVAAKAGLTTSDAASATYTLQAATPTFTPPAGTYLLPQLVSILDASPGVTIYYTTNGSTPTTSSSVYTGRILIVPGTTLKAIAVRAGWTNSPVATAVYGLGL
jgi:hypothetical protein